MNPTCLLRYDTETDDAAQMRGFLPKLVEVHRRHAIPATLFCTGRMLEARADEFRDFAAEVRGDALFELQSHSYGHIGVGYEAGSTLDVLRADYERAVGIHESVLGQRPNAVSICGTGGKDGPRLKGFEQTSKSRAELDMLVSLGIRRINTFLASKAEDLEFCDYADLDHPDVVGFPSGFSDTAWMLQHGAPDWLWHRREPFTDAVAGIVREIERRGREHLHMPIMLHDWAAWCHAPDRELDHVKRFAEAARRAGLALATHGAACDART
jgi:peptidoglycan/xylan/chitin deacetylase (PgdA/CDA1 family)